MVLLGQSAIEISLEGRDEPVVREIPAEDFARFVARLEQISYASLSRDPRETATADPRAMRSSPPRGWPPATRRTCARPRAPRPVFESTHEKHGFVNAHESILPVDLVLRGDIEIARAGRVPARPPARRLRATRCSTTDSLAPFALGRGAVIASECRQPSPAGVVISGASPSAGVVR